MTDKKIIISYTEYDNTGELSAQDRILAEAAVKATRNAYTPYSHFNVGAAIRLSNGEIVTGANQENMAYPSGLCAERTAMFHASAQYPDAAMEALALAAVKNGELCPVPATPCGACRQVMAEFGIPKIVMSNLQGDIKIMTAEELLPYSFNVASMDEKGEK